MSYCKLFRKDLNHYGFQYTTGFNKYDGEIGVFPQESEARDNPWSATDGAIITRGISFSTRQTVWKWLDLHADIYWVAEVRMLSSSSSIVQDLGGGHYLTNQCIISNFQDIPTFLATVPNEERMQIINTCQSGFTFIPNPTEKECLTAVFRYGHLLQFIKSSALTKEICNVAVRSNPWAIQYVPEQWRDLSLVPETIRRTLRI